MDFSYCLCYSINEKEIEITLLNGLCTNIILTLYLNMFSLRNIFKSIVISKMALCYWIFVLNTQISWSCKKLSTETHLNHFNWQLEWHKTGQRTHVLPLRLRIDDTNFKISFTLTNIMISNLQWKCQRQPWMAKVVESFRHRWQDPSK